MRLAVLFSVVMSVTAAPAAAAPDDESIAWRIRAGSKATSSIDASATGGSREPFDAVGISWSAETGSRAKVRVRVSRDGERWSEWTPLPLDGDLTDRSNGRYLSTIARFDTAQRFIEYSFSAAVEDVTLTMFRPADRQRGPKRVSTELSYGAIPMRSRVEWGCPDGEASRWTPAYTTVTHAVVHHTAGSNSAPDWDTEVRNIWYYHTLTNGWGDIGYNFLIAPDGVIYEGRAGGNGAIGAHFSCRNTNTAGVSLLGTFTATTPTDAALASLKRLLGEISTTNAIDAEATVRHAPSGLNLPTILGHRDGNVPGATCTITECPGDALYSMLPAIRTDVACRPIIEAQPSAAVVRPGDTVTFSVRARGGEPLSYQWYSGDAAIEGATGASLTVTALETASYRVRVTNSCGSADSVSTFVIVSAGRRRVARP